MDRSNSYRPGPSHSTTRTDLFTINVRSQTFYLSRSQIQFDSPNYFTDAFFGEFSESQTRTLNLDCNPELFQLIIDYLSGYDILPLNDSAIPRTMNLSQAKKNLLKDVIYLSLSGLEKRLIEERKYVNSFRQLDDNEEVKAMVSLCLEPNHSFCKCLDPQDLVKYREFQIVELANIGVEFAIRLYGERFSYGMLSPSLFFILTMPSRVARGIIGLPNASSSQAREENSRSNFSLPADNHDREEFNNNNPTGVAITPLPSLPSPTNTFARITRIWNIPRILRTSTPGNCPITLDNDHHTLSQLCNVPHSCLNAQRDLGLVPVYLRSWEKEAKLGEKVIVSLGRKDNGEWEIASILGIRAKSPVQVFAELIRD